MAARRDRRARCRRDRTGSTRSRRLASCVGEVHTEKPVEIERFPGVLDAQPIHSVSEESEIRYWHAHGMVDLVLLQIGSRCYEAFGFVRKRRVPYSA